MSTLLITHACFVGHDTGPGHPERPDRMRAINKALGCKEFSFLLRKVEERMALTHPREFIDAMREPARMRARPCTSMATR